ncbi:MAG: ABC transporter permease [Thiohalocapsa sp.]
MQSLRIQRRNLDGQSLPAAGLLRRFAPRNDVVVVLLATALAATLTTGFVTLAPNRLVSGQPIGLVAAAGPGFAAVIAALGAALLMTALRSPSRGLHLVAAVLAGALLLVALAAAGRAAARLEIGAPALARISLGPGFWILLTAASLAVVDGLQRAAAGPRLRLLAATALIAAFLLMAAAGVFDALSLAHEYRARQDSFAAAMLRHVVLVVAAVGPALLIGFPLGIAAVRRPQFQGPLFALLNLLQTIPSIALFGLLLVPLSALASAVPALAAIGIGGVGPAPAIIALILYALLPVARNSTLGIAGADPAVVEAARGMGMTPRQLFLQVELPLAMPVLLAGLRIVLVQTIGLAVVAALIGAGGLGRFVFAGLGQYAGDLVLLGALPAIGLALAADFLLKLLTALITPGARR